MIKVVLYGTGKVPYNLAHKLGEHIPIIIEQYYDCETLKIRAELLVNSLKTEENLILILTKHVPNIIINYIKDFLERNKTNNKVYKAVQINKLYKLVPLMYT